MLGYQPGMIIIERFELKVRLGAGAMGIVFGAVDRKLNEDVAMKFLPLAMAEDREAVNQFAEEVKRARRVSGRYVLRVYDMWDDGEGGHFVTMEWAKGGDLNSYRRQRGLVAWEETKKLLAPILRGLQTVHEAGIVHRDVKPGNILFREDGTPIVADFGISKSIMASMSRISQDTSISGTPAYMAPEAIRGTDDIGPATDLYAVGCMAYEMLAGHTPFTGDAMSVMYNQTHSDPSFRDLQLEAVRWIGACLIKDVGKRVQSAEELLEGLENPNRLPEYVPLSQPEAPFAGTTLSSQAFSSPQPATAEEGRTYKLGAKPQRGLVGAAETPLARREMGPGYIPLLLGLVLVVLVILVVLVAKQSGDRGMTSAHNTVAEQSIERPSTAPSTPSPAETRRERIAALERRAQEQFDAKKYTSPAGDNAWETCETIRAEDPKNAACLELIADMKQQYGDMIVRSLAQGKCASAEGHATALARIGGGLSYVWEIAACRERIAEVARQKAEAERLIEDREEAARRSEDEALANLRDTVAGLRESLGVLSEDGANDHAFTQYQKLSQIIDRAAQLTWARNLEDGQEQADWAFEMTTTIREAIVDGRQQELEALGLLGARREEAELKSLVMMPAELEKWASPIYPRLAQQAGIEGRVVVEFEVGTDGKARDFVIVESLPAGCDDAAIEAIKRMVFTPATQGGSPVPTRIKMTFMFKKS